MKIYVLEDWFRDGVRGALVASTRFRAPLIAIRRQGERGLAWKI
jgi:hypothetical protein